MTELQRPGVVRCRACPWASDAPDMDTAMALFEQHTQLGHLDNPYAQRASFQILKDEHYRIVLN